MSQPIKLYPNKLQDESENMTDGQIGNSNRQIYHTKLQLLNLECFWVSYLLELIYVSYLVYSETIIFP